MIDWYTPTGSIPGARFEAPRGSVWSIPGVHLDLGAGGGHPEQNCSVFNTNCIKKQSFSMAWCAPPLARPSFESFESFESLLNHSKGFQENQKIQETTGLIKRRLLISLLIYYQPKSLKLEWGPCPFDSFDSFDYFDRILVSKISHRPAEPFDSFDSFESFKRQSKESKESKVSVGRWLIMETRILSK